MADVDITGKEREKQVASPPSPLALPVVLAGTFMVVLDFFIVNVAIPAVQHELDAGTDQVQLIVAGYGLAYACGLITAGRLGDIFGRRRLYVVGLLLFTVASLVCGIAPSATVLVLARIVQGMGAAVLSPQVLTILGVTYTGAARARAFSAYGMVLATASVGGQLIGGALIQADVAGLGWRSCFLINVPIGLVALLLTPRVVPESRAQVNSRLDIPGALLVTLGLVAVVLPLVEGREKGWPAWTWVCLVLAVPLLGSFAWYQHRLGGRDGAPLVDLALFRQRAFTVGLSAVLVFYAGAASFFLVLALYLQQGRGLSALDSGLTFAVMGIGFFVTSLSARRLGALLGKQALAIGGVLLAVGQLWLLLAVSHIGVEGSIWALVPALLLDGAGLGMVMAPLNATVLAGIPPHLAGAASGVLTTMMQVGNALGVALIGIIYYHRAGVSPASTADGLDAGLVLLIALALALAVAIQLLPGKPKQPAGA
ncbi:DHA2 family efflux MFS transporter permease subunit [Streptomyces odontomachi]|uniref:DHA2 family efflux MFS transporter permease subunit n=1 Tax=Streptomyces odontomachi TaxID=2944940 RepID=UPI00210E1D6B|nr:DHA2 family efflux MFS transporter permease subunit [Streptomyces sp. ODS25]